MLIFFIDTSVWATDRLKQRPFLFGESFEDRDPVQFWTSNGSYIVHFKGVTEDEASEGRRSFKLDVTLKKATYAYWYIPVRVPSVGELRFSGDIWVTGAAGAVAALGTNISLAPAPVSGVNVLNRFKSPTNGWVTETFDLSEADTKVEKLVRKHIGGATTACVGNWIDRVGIFVYARSGGRITILVDNVWIKGVIPEPVQYQCQVAKQWSEYQERTKEDVRRQVQLIRSYNPANLTLQNRAFAEESFARVDEIEKAVSSRGYPSGEEYAELVNRKEEFLQVQNVESILNRTKGPAFVIYPWNPFAEQKILPQTYPIHADLGEVLHLQACRGESEPASFVIRALKPLSGVRISVPELLGANGNRFSSSAVDIRVVKCWYQAGRELWEVDKRILVPELLLKNDSLVKVDMETQDNFIQVRVEGLTRYIRMSRLGDKLPKRAILEDAADLIPFDLPAFQNKQVWLTVNVPPGIASGDYEGKIRVEADGESPSEITLKLSILPFGLEPSPVEYAIYYRGKLSEATVPDIGSEWKTTEQYMAELENMFSHGIKYPTLYQNYDDVILEKALNLRNRVGFPSEHLYVLGLTTGNPQDSAGLDRLARKVEQWRGKVRANGYGEVYFYGIDEAKGAKLASQRSAWQQVQLTGGKVFAACYLGAEAIVGDLLDVAVLHGSLKPLEAKAWHRRGRKVFSYANPQVGIEDPRVYRSNYGIALLVAGYDGAMDYAYQHSFGEIWNDFDHRRYRDLVFAYPTTRGIIDTVAWEGFREAIDDTCYIATLANMRNEAIADLMTRFLARAGETYNLGTRRDKIIRKILDRMGVNSLHERVNTQENS